MEFEKIVPQEVLYMLEKLQGAGHKAYLVGGCVRDCLMGKDKPHDWDIATSAMPIEVSRVFIPLGLPVLGTGIKHGTVTVVGNDDRYEVTTFRQDGEYSDGRHPDTVNFNADINEDLARRDFTINAMAWNPAEGLVDPFGGRTDIAEGIIRCVGDPSQRFQEDGLRILRALRFSAALGFSIDARVLVTAGMNLYKLDFVSEERKRDELMKLLMGKDAGRVLLDYCDILTRVIPEIKPCIGFDQHNPYHMFNVWEHIAVSVHNAVADPVIRLTMLLHDIGKPHCFQMGEDGRGHFHGHGKVSAEIAKEVLANLRFDNKTSQTVTQLVAIHDQFIEPTNKAVRRLLNRIGPDQFDRLMDVRMADIKAQDPNTLAPRIAKIELLREMRAEITDKKECVSAKDLAVNGRDLIALGVNPGPGMGAILADLLDKVLDDPALNKKEILLELVQNQVKE